MIAMLVQHAGWKVLSEVAEEEIIKREKAVQRQVLSRDLADQRLADLTRGFRAGIHWVISREPEITSYRKEKHGA